MTDSLKKVTIYTDGACLGNPGPGGYAAILRYGSVEKVIAGGDRETTNNRMELLAVIEALAALKERCNVTVYSDSQYVVNGMEKGWAKNWRLKGWKRAGNQPVLNVDLWERLLSLAEKHYIRFVWVRGHSGHPENERVDSLAVEKANFYKEKVE